MRSYGKKSHTDLPAWEIVAGWERFQKQPLVCFAAGPEWKLDVETMPALATAVQKFGLSPDNLRVINDWIIKSGTKYLGSYDHTQDKITLSSRSLSLLAHEGLHRLLQRGLIPKKEYTALVQAGKNMVAEDSSLEVRLNHVRSPGATNIARQQKTAEEYAALFVEKYYEREKTARQYLMGQRVPKFKKVISYVRTIVDKLAGRLGHSPALARAFLRRIEQNEFNYEQPAAARNDNARGRRHLSERPRQ